MNDLITKNRISAGIKTRRHFISERRNPMDTKKMNRREFMLLAGSAAVALPLAAALGGCGGGGSSSPAQAGDITVISTVTNSHSHSISIKAADLTAGVDKTYTTTTDGAIPHSHTLTIPAAQFNDVNANKTDNISTNADATAHTHEFPVKKS